MAVSALALAIIAPTITISTVPILIAGSTMGSITGSLPSRINALGQVPKIALTVGLNMVVLKADPITGSPVITPAISMVPEAIIPSTSAVPEAIALSFNAAPAKVVPKMVPAAALVVSALAHNVAHNKVAHSGNLLF